MPSEILEIDPHILADLHQFEWWVRALAHGHTIGKKQSRKVGSGLEFSQYRPYSQGDDLRQLDWKMYARTDKFYIRQSEIETNLSITFIPDTSASMQYAEGGWSKLNYTKLLIGTLAYVARTNGDRFNLADGEGSPAGADQRYWLRFLQRVQQLNAKGRFQEAFLRGRGAKELIIIFSDLYEAENEWQRYISSLRTRQNEVIVFHVLGEQERLLSWSRTSKFQDLETGDWVEADPRQLREHYQHKLANWQESLKNTFLGKGIEYIPIGLEQPIAEVVNHFLQRRKRLIG